MEPACKCVDDQYKMDCPYTFEQGGSRFHCIGGNVKALPAESDGESDDSWERNSENTGLEGFVDALKHANARNEIEYKPVNPSKNNNVMQYLIPSEREQKLDSRMFRDMTAYNHNLSQGSMNPGKDDSANEFLAANRTTLKKFEALHLNGKSINDYSIGGFKLDLGVTTKKVKELAPLPPNALPKIFIDDNLNFYHHFFKGMEMLLGGTKFQEITDSRIHHESVTEDLPNSIIGFMESGLCAGDSALTLLVKKVLSSTFEKSVISDEKNQKNVLKVETNLWGFRYIEPGMVLADADIRMWLANCYSYYRTIWFDTFKSSSVPAFAIEGVIVNTSKPILKISQRSQNDFDNRDHRYVESARQLIREQYPERRRKSNKPSRKNSWF